MARARQRGFGNALASQSNAAFASAWGNLGRGDNDEWQLGVELELPIGFRRVHAAVRNAELSVARETALLREQEQQVLFGLSNAVADVERAYKVLMAQYNRLGAADRQVEVLTQRYRDVRTSIDIVLDAQRRRADSQTRFRQAQVEYMLALKNVHFEKGTLLEHNGVFLAESGAPADARISLADRRASRRRVIDYVSRDPVISAGRAASGNLPGTTAAAGGQPISLQAATQQPATPDATQAGGRAVASDSGAVTPAAGEANNAAGEANNAAGEAKNTAEPLTFPSAVAPLSTPGQPIGPEASPGTNDIGESVGVSAVVGR
ncbi:MAG: TolC family protein [Planctomycetota bacterium]